MVVDPDLRGLVLFVHDHAVGDNNDESPCVVEMGEGVVDSLIFDFELVYGHYGIVLIDDQVVQLLLLSDVLHLAEVVDHGGRTELLEMEQ